MRIKAIIGCPIMAFFLFLWEKCQIIMKRYNLVVLFVLTSIIMMLGGNILDNRSRAIADELLRQRKQLIEQKRLKVGEKDSLAPTYYPVVIKISNDSVIDDLRSLGTIIMRQRDNFLLACLPLDSLDAISRLPLVNRMSLSSPMSKTLDKAIVMTGMNKVHSGIDLPQSYNGEGVVVGISDIGFDHTHPAFADGRLKRVVAYDELHALKYDMQTDDEIREWTTDTPLEWHASHVAGILAGNYQGNPFRGVATGSDVVITTSSLYDMAILAGVEDIIDYAKSVGKPAVINLSLGNYVGAHDGTSLNNQYLDLLGEEAIICLSSGNEGKKKAYISFDVTKENDELKTFVYDVPDINGKELKGDIDIWSGDTAKLTIAMTIYDRITKTFVFTSPFLDTQENDAASMSVATPSLLRNGDIAIPIPDEELTGVVSMYSAMNLENNRFNVYATVDIKNHQLDESGLLGRYCIGFIIKGAIGTHIDAYANSSRVIFNGLGVDGFLTGNSTRSISDLACGKNIIAVGACNSRNETPRVDGTVATYNFAVDNVANFSGYGTLEDGRVLPHFCAPGNMIVAPVSSWFTALCGEKTLQAMAVKESINGKDYYWISECGTSMASPHAAGIIACWLQADPSLSVKDIVEIAQSTANKSYSDISDPKWGAGNIDAYAGLKEVLKRGGIGNVSYNKDEVLFHSIGNKEFYVEIPNSEMLELNLYSISGSKVLTQPNGYVDARNLASGVYIISVLHSKGECVERILIK